MRAAGGQQVEPRAGVYAESNGGGQQPWKKFVYVEPPRRVKEVLEEELCFRRDECRIKHPSEVALEGIWSLKRNFPVGGFQPASQNQNSLFLQPKYYSRHAVLRTSASRSAMQACEATWRKFSRRRRPRVALLAAGLALCTLLALYASSSLGPSFLQPPLSAWWPEEEEKEERPPLVRVLLWWEPFGRQRGLGGCEERFHIGGCQLTTDRSLLLEAQAVLFHHRDMVHHGLDLLPTSRLPAQRWVWMNFESPSHSHHLQDLGGLFNWTMTYKVDSDVFVPYGYLRPSRAPHHMDPMPKKTKLVAWVISNWNEEHARVRYYRRLKDHLPIDVYGAQGLDLKDDSVVQTVSEYKFYLAFENSQHPDYITEKLWRNAFKAWAVPIVLGPPRANYELFIPSDSFIHVEDFSDPGQLAVYLKFLDKNKSRYRRYFAWRKHYDVQVTSFWDEHCCRVCNAVRTAGKQRKTIQNLANWFES